MSQLDETQQNVARYYDNEIFESESVRLLHRFPIEFAITSRYLHQWIPEGTTVADIGVGVGHYAELLAKRGCSLYLIDISERLLDAAYARLKALNLQERILKVHLASATNLSCLEAGTLDAVLLLGPLYHLCSLESRQLAVNEAARVLKHDGILLAAGINRLTYFRDLLHQTSEQVLSRRDFHKQLLQDGNLDPVHAPPIGYAHLTTAIEFRQLFAERFDEIMLVGTESFSSPYQEIVNTLAPAEVEAWLDLIEETGRTPEGLGMADHFLYIGRKQASVSARSRL